MQRLISKYGLAAHLAFLAVAPLFLFPFCGEQWVSRVLLWLSLFAAVWIFMAPSRHPDEMLHEARVRVIEAMVRDPLFWLMLTVAVFAFFCSLNGGVGMTYDAEESVWSLASPTASFFPGCVDGKGALPFATAVAGLVLALGCGHALGRSARLAFVFLIACMAGLAALIATIYALFEDRSLLVLEPLEFLDPAFVGVAFGLGFLASLTALCELFEMKWKLATPFLLLAIGGTAVGLFHFAPACVVTVFTGAAIWVLAWSLVYTGVKSGVNVVSKCLAMLIIALLVPALFVVGFTPPEFAAPRLRAFTEGALFPVDFGSVRAMLSTIAEKVWQAYPWRGSGIGSFGLDIRFTATPEDWALLKPAQEGALNGWWQILAERGIVGTIFLVIPMLFLLWNWLVRLGGAVGAAIHGHSAKRWLLLINPLAGLGLSALVLTVACGFVEHSFERPETMLLVVSLFALAGSSFPAVRKSNAEAGREAKANG